MLLIGLAGMPLLGFFAFDNLWPTVVSVGGLILGWLLRKQIVDMFEWTSWAVPGALLVYGVLLFFGERFGLSREGQLLIVTFTTVAIFNLQFWQLSDPSIVKVDDD